MAGARNLIGNCVATVVAAAPGDDLDRAEGMQVLDGADPVDATGG